VSISRMAAAPLQRLGDRVLGEPGRDRRRRERAAATATSLLIHAVILLFVTASLGGAVVSGGAGTPDGDAGAVFVTLSGLKGGGAPKEAHSTAELAALFQKVRDQQSPLAIDTAKPQPKASLDKLFNDIDREHAPKTDPAKRAGQGDTDRGGAGAGATGVKTAVPDRQGRPSAAKDADGPGAAASSGALWGQIAPCWRSMPGVSTVPVTLEIKLNGGGLIAVPPRILRPAAAAPDERRLLSEARALAAVTACAPYHGVDITSGKGIFRVDFVPGR
jgi:hypothetical protein